MNLRLTERVDLNVYYDAERSSASEAMLSVVTREVFAAFYADCPSVGFEEAGQPIGGVIFDGESAHIAVLPSHHGRWGLLLGPTLAWLFSLKDEILLRTPADNPKALRFIEHCGWQRLGIEDGEVVHRLRAHEVDARGLARGLARKRRCLAAQRA